MNIQKSENRNISNSNKVEEKSIMKSFHLSTEFGKDLTLNTMDHITTTYVYRHLRRYTIIGDTYHQQFRYPILLHFITNEWLHTEMQKQKHHMTELHPVDVHTLQKTTTDHDSIAHDHALHQTDMI